MPLRPGHEQDEPFPEHRSVYARAWGVAEMQDGIGGFYTTTVNGMKAEQNVGFEHLEWSAASSDAQHVENDDRPPLEVLYGPSNKWDDEIYDTLLTQVSRTEQTVILDRHEPSHRKRSELSYRGPWLDPLASYSSAG